MVRVDFMKEEKNCGTAEGGCSALTNRFRSNSLRKKRKRYWVDKYLLAFTLSLGLGTGFSGQVLAADTSPQVIKAVVSGTQGTNGWYTGNVGVTWNVTDPQSSITKKSGCGNVTLTTDTSGVTYTCTATSSGGTSSQSVTIKRDSTPPKVTIVAPAGGATYTQNQAVKASYTCSDSISGVSTCTGTAANGGTSNVSTLGPKNFSVQSTDKAGNTTQTAISYTVAGATATSANGTHLFAWNDLGMHCADSDFSIFTLLPPFNNLNAQLVVKGKLVNTGYALKYVATPDPTGSVNSSSQNKTNFWTFAKPLFGVTLAPNIGLTGNPTPSYTPAPLAWNGTYSWYEATGLPITPVDDNLSTNYFPMINVTATDGLGNGIASSTAVLPISSEINCKTCHASVTGSSAAKPTAGWVNNKDLEKDWRLNILRLHDQKNAGAGYTNLLTQKGYGTGLYASATANNKPVMCDSCHNSNALAVWGIKGTAGISDMTAAMHKRHAGVTLPGSTQKLDTIKNRSACYNCHPGAKTQCLRGAMGNPVDTTGKHLMECQSCHGGLGTVSNAARQGWFDMPTCQSCHHDGKRETVAINANGTFKTWADTRFASNPNTPSTGWSLFRFSTGHGKLQCEACHNSTHAEFTNQPSANGNQTNDNLTAIKAQGYAAAIRECLVCHTTMPSSANGGPHGMHNLGQSWVGSHHDAFNSVSKTSCTYCHGTTSSGSPLAVIKVAKTFNIENRTVTFAANERVTCWSCHNGPNP